MLVQNFWIGLPVFIGIVRQSLNHALFNIGNRIAMRKFDTPEISKF